MVKPQQVEQTVDQEDRHPLVEAHPVGCCFPGCSVQGDDHIAEEFLGQMLSPSLLHGKGQDVGRPLFVAVLLVELRHVGVVKEQNAQFAPRAAAEGQQPVGPLPELFQADARGRGRLAGNEYGHGGLSVFWRLSGGAGGGFPCRRRRE